MKFNGASESSGPVKHTYIIGRDGSVSKTECPITQSMGVRLLGGKNESRQRTNEFYSGEATKKLLEKIMRK